MRKFTIPVNVTVYNINECNESYRMLIDKAKESSQKAYAPYSEFKVGAAILFSDGTVITANNQENAAYPSGLCAERTALFYAGANYREKHIEAICIAAFSDGKFTSSPCPPCGACRQVLIETEQRNKKPIKIILYSDTEIYEIAEAKHLLPLQFSADFLS